MVFGAICGVVVQSRVGKKLINQNEPLVKFEYLKRNI